jgi:NADPH-dependent 2,4-dienoyl-CoA reductase/sulfur reductase-like enzyme
MCRHDIDNPPSSTLKHVVIAGSGPAGLLLTALLMQRNDELPTPFYKITLLDNRQDLSLLTQEELKKSFRSWMLGLVSFLPMWSGRVWKYFYFNIFQN